MKNDIKADAVFGTRAVQRGGNANNGANAGVFSMNLNNAPSNSNRNIGFRCPPNYFKHSVWSSSKSLICDRRELSHPISLGCWGKANRRENFGICQPNQHDCVEAKNSLTKKWATASKPLMVES
ncbi:hypothetical protein [Candidatus Nanohalobium constans]|uniref:hypothetical protein n=1 Tax=Candidatus Nanohalobium constans TaxID=2565781 RepID=UPI00129839D8|nr:hypothetical protein [Candidatus Nanohalobium constans]